MNSPFDGLAIPPLAPELLARYHSARLRSERIKDILDRAFRRTVIARQRRREEPTAAPEEEEAIRRELDRLTPANAEEVRARLRVLGGMDPDPRRPREIVRASSRDFRGRRLAALDAERRRCLADAEQLSVEAWCEVQARHPEVARRWETAYRSLMTSTVQERLVASGIFETEWFQRQIGESLLASASYLDREGRDSRCR